MAKCLAGKYLVPSSRHPPLIPSSPSSSRSPHPSLQQWIHYRPQYPRHSTSSPNSTLPLSPAPTHSTLEDSPLTLTSDSFDLLFTPTFSSLPSNSSPLEFPKHSFDLGLSRDAPTCYQAQVATTTGSPAVALQQVGGARTVKRLQRLAKGTPVVRSRLAFYPFLNIFHLTPYSQSDSEAALGGIIACRSRRC